MKIFGLKDYEVDYIKYVKRKHYIKEHWDDERQHYDLAYL